MNLNTIFKKIDEINSKDPNKEVFQNVEYPKEILYSKRMVETLTEYVPNPSQSIQIAARGQHIQRWAIPRSDYPMDKKGYLKWRTVLKTYHAELIGELMEQEGADKDLIEQVKTLVTKRKLKTDTESKALEDVVCLVFIKYYLPDFASKYNEEKVLGIIRKTWAKMTPEGHEAALKLPMESSQRELVNRALS